MAEAMTAVRTFDLPLPLLTVRQAAEMLGRTPAQVYRLIAAGRLSANQELGVTLLRRDEVQELGAASGAAEDDEPLRFTTSAHPVPSVDLEAEILGNEASASYSLRERSERLYRTLGDLP